MPFPSGSSGSSSTLASSIITQVLHSFTVGQALYWTGTAYAKGRADSATTSEILGIVATVPSANTFTLATAGTITGLSSLTSGEVYWLSDVTAGLATTTQPTAVGSVSKPLFVATSATTAQIQIFDTSPAQSQTSVVEYLNIVTNAIQTVTGNSTVNTASAAVTFLTPTVVGNIPVNTTTGKITLSAGKTYTLSAKVPSLSTGAVFQWVNSTSSTFIGERWDVSPSSPALNGNSPTVIITPTVSTDVYIQSTFAGSAALGVNDGNGVRGVSVHVEQIGASPVPMDLVGEYVAPVYLTGGNITTTGTTSATAIDVLSITIPTAGTWLVEWTVRGGNPGVANEGVMTGLYDNSNVFQPNSETNSIFSNGTINVQSSGTGFYYVTTTGAATYKVRAWSNSVAGGLVLSDTNGRSFVTARKISGFVPSSGQTIDYYSGNLISNTYAANAPFQFSTNGGNIPYSAGDFTLTAGKTYLLQASLTYSPSGSNSLNYRWKNQTSGASIGNVALVISMNSTTIAGAQPVATAVITPTVTTIVRLENLGANSSFSGESFVYIQQLGSSAVIAGVYPGVWTDFTPSITSTGTAPTFATTHTKNASYLIQGKTMLLRWSYYAASATGATLGTSVYKVPIPSGYTIDNTKAILPTVITTSSNNYSGADATPLGMGMTAQTGASDSFTVVALSSTELGFFVTSNPSLIGAGYHSLNVANRTIQFTATIPLL